MGGYLEVILAIAATIYVLGAVIDFFVGVFDG